MSSCDPHPLILSPCADDTVAVGQVLGTSGDVSFDEAGSVQLQIDQTSAEVEFGYEKVSEDYIFEDRYIKTEDENPVDIRPVIKSQTTKKFVVDLTGVPVTANSILFWRVVVPDPLRTCPGLTNQPKYAIVPEPQSGIQPLLVNSSFIAVTFPYEQPDDTYQFYQLEVVTTVFSEWMIFVFVVKEKTKAGFKLELNGAPIEVGYFLHWRIA